MVMHQMNLNALDLNLLRVFDAVYQCGNVTRAAEKIYLSQPAVSHALTRLRHHLKDDLFVKMPGGVKPTPRAHELATPINDALNLLENAVNPPEFVPEKSHQVFRIATHDYIVTTLMPVIAEYVNEAAPGISIRLHPTEGKTLQLLDNHEVDMAISAFGELPERFMQRQIFEDRYVSVVRRGHALCNVELDVERFSQARHLLVSPRGDERGFIDTLLAKTGRTRHIAMIINQFAPAASIVAASDMILTVPKRLADMYALRYDLEVLQCPLQAPDAFMKTSVIWHRRLGQHPAFQWLQDVIINLAKG